MTSRERNLGFLSAFAVTATMMLLACGGASSRAGVQGGAADTGSQGGSTDPGAQGGSTGTGTQGTSGPVAAALQVVSSHTQSGSVGQALPDAVVVRVVDSAGAPVEGQLVNFRVTEGGGSVLAGIALTDADGTAQERWTLGILASPQVLEARAVDPETGDAIASATFHATAMAGSPATIALAAGDAQTGQIGDALPLPVVVKVTDQHGNAVPGATVTFGAAVGNGSATPPSPSTDASGVASSTWTLGSTIGAQRLQATAEGLAPVTFSATANDLPPRDLAYATPNATYTKGVQITPNTPSSSGGAVVSYSVSPALPAGLELSATSGIICGTPTAVTPTATYTVTATNTGGSTTADLIITVNDVAPSDLTYSTNPATYAAGAAIAPNAPSNQGGAVVVYSIAPALPAGLSLGDSTGVLSGTPTRVTPPTAYTVTASNSGGTTTGTLTIEVTDPSLVIAASPSDQIVSIGQAATFGATGSGTGLTYQWYKDGAPIPDATAASYQTPPATLSDAGAKYSVVVGDTYGGTVTSGAAALIIQGFTPTGSMSAGRANLTATALQNGLVLVAGGYNSNGVLSSAELYDSNTGTFAATGSMSTERMDFTGSALQSGKVLVAGGQLAGGAAASAELYDPDTGEFTSVGSMAIARYRHTATLLPDGTVLVAGGASGGTALATAELYDPATGAFTPTGNDMSSARIAATATLLGNGKVLIAGGAASGSTLATAELYDPATKTFTPTGSMTVPRDSHTASLLQDGTVLVAAGDCTASGAPCDGFSATSAEQYDPIAETFSRTGDMRMGRSRQTATVLQNGLVLIAGGDRGQSVADNELYDPATRSFTTTGEMQVGRTAHAAVLLPSGEVLIVGGDSYVGTPPNVSDSYPASAELFDPQEYGSP